MCCLLVGLMFVAEVVVGLYFVAFLSLFMRCYCWLVVCFNLIVVC